MSEFRILTVHAGGHEVAKAMSEHETQLTAHEVAIGRDEAPDYSAESPKPAEVSAGPEPLQCFCFYAWAETNEGEPIFSKLRRIERTDGVICPAHNKQPKEVSAAPDICPQCRRPRGTGMWCPTCGEVEGEVSAGQAPELPPLTRPKAMQRYTIPYADAVLYWKFEVDNYIAERERQLLAVLTELHALRSQVTQKG